MIDGMYATIILISEMRRWIFFEWCVVFWVRLSAFEPLGTNRELELTVFRLPSYFGLLFVRSAWVLSGAYGHVERSSLFD